MRFCPKCVILYLMKIFLAIITIFFFFLLAVFGFVMMVHTGDHNGCLINNPLTSECLVDAGSLDMVNAHFEAFSDFLSVIFSARSLIVILLLFLFVVFFGGGFLSQKDIYVLTFRRREYFNQPIFYNERILGWVVVKKNEF